MPLDDVDEWETPFETLNALNESVSAQWQEWLDRTLQEMFAACEVPNVQNDRRAE